MTSRDIRETFLRFFEERGHRRVPSAPVVPRNDPTLHFTNAGMNQFKDVFLGTGRRSYTRAVDTQKCIRGSGKHNDLEEVGKSPWHHTFFEMMGNWSFGDYFKKEAIEWAWELATEHLGLEKERLWSTVFEGDQSAGLEPDVEAESLWTECTDQPLERVVRLPGAEVFWEMGATGPCGPSSELHYYLGADPSRQSRAGFLRGGDDYVEIWNLVFIQYNRDEAGKLHPLPSVHVDTGMGLERMCSILQGVRSNYDTDLFQPLIARVAELTAKDYKDEYLVPMQVVADHVRALCFAIADGAVPSNEGAGYVLRRLLRRAARYGRQLDQQEPFIHQLAPAVADVFANVFPEVAEKSAHISLVIRSEEESFGKTLDRGLEIFDRYSRKGEISGSDAFQLYDTYGFPLDLTQLLARERGLEINTEEFDRELEGQRQRARQAAKVQLMETEDTAGMPEVAHSCFIGYEELAADSKVLHAEEDENGPIRFFLDQTPFYAESGGQVGDKGLVRGGDFVIQVENTLKARGGHMHIGRMLEGECKAVEGMVQAQVDPDLRRATARNHTATHLLHEALRRVLGDHVAQMGSLVASERLRFDFSHFATLEQQQLREIESMVNDRVRAGLEVSTFEEDLEKARDMGAQALFGEKYEDRVRVVRIGDFSLELCGGTHVDSTSEIGLFHIAAEGGIAAGIRRVEAFTGRETEQIMRSHHDLLQQMSNLMNVRVAELPRKLEGLLHRNRDLEDRLEALQRQDARQLGIELAAQAREMGEVRVLATRVEVEEAGALRTLADNLREHLGSGLGVIGTVLNGKVSLIAVVTQDLIETRGLNAGDIVKRVARLVGGSGGGKAHLAQAGGKDAEKLDQALSAVPAIVEELLAE